MDILAAADAAASTYDYSSSGYSGRPDTIDETDEDEAGVHVANWGCSVAQAGWLHDRAGRPGVWAASDMETFSVWSAEVRFPLSSPYPHLLS